LPKILIDGSRPIVAKQHQRNEVGLRLVQLAEVAIGVGSCGTFPALSLDGMFLLTPDQHLTVAKDLRRQVNDPKAQELATAHEKLAVAI
jgi:uncharacterized FAD-dependent dehydrogenase